MELRLDDDERELLRRLPEDVRELLDDEDDPVVRRLFPPAYRERPEHEAEYRELMGDELRERHRTALSLMASTVDNRTLTDEEASRWLAALNDVRLVLGTSLDVSEDVDTEDLDPTDPRTAGFALYNYLSFLQQELVEVMAEGL